MPMNGLRLAQQALQLAGSESPQLLDTLAAAYAEAGRFDEAVATARKALTAATQANKEQLAKDIQGRLELYAARQPYRSPS